MGLAKVVKTAAAATLGVALCDCGGAPASDPIDDTVEALTGTYSLRAVNSGKCAGVVGKSTADGAAIHQYTCSGQTSQLWTLQTISSGVYELISKNSGKCLDVAQASTSNGPRSSNGPARRATIRNGGS